MRKAFLFIILLVVFSGSLLSYTDERHFSRVFNEERSFRVFTPPDYYSLNKMKRYPVIYYFHGCGGSYEKSGPYSYADYGLTPPSVIGRKHDPAYDFSSNADFENFTYNNDVIIICVDGKINGLDGCGVYIPGEEYKLVHYSYKKDEIWEEKTRADRNGKLVLTTRGGAGEEIGITGKELQPPVIILTDTINENIYLENNCLTPLSFELLNLSESARPVEISAASGSTDILSFTRHTSTILLQAGSRIKADSMLICKALISSPEKNRAFIPDAYDRRDTNTWHPVIPINNANNPGVVFEDITFHSFSTGRSLMSAMIRMDKKPSEEYPLSFAVQSELLRTEVIDDHCHRPVADGFGYAYLNIHISEDGSAIIISKE